LGILGCCRGIGTALGSSPSRTALAAAWVARADQVEYLQLTFGERMPVHPFRARGFHRQ
jgi:hypothetical protein